ncbi:hypothetical protein ABS315_11235 [Peribacillus frigoritolerans]|uniref:hypothetical protein n=1 Tax=Peribacillus frigoritolerans TaxID=450367 RepID=UPI0034E0B4F5
MNFKNDFKVHNEWDRKILKSSEGKNRYYRVFVGDVTWNDGIERLACIVFIQHGNSEDWKTACKNREIVFDNPAHILFQDYEIVDKACKDLIARNSK